MESRPFRVRGGVKDTVKWGPMADVQKRLNRTVERVGRWLPHDRVPWVIAGPCSAESLKQMLSTARGVAKSPYVRVFRAGLWKPRTRPGTFEGVGSVGLDWLAAVKAETGLMTTTEVANTEHVELCLRHEVDVLWIGARTTVSPFSVQEIANALRGVDMPVLVKNPINADLGLWLGALERLRDAGIRKLAAIHRGFSTYIEMEFRNSPNWQIPIELKRQVPNLPLICDPSHITGKRELIEPISQTALDLGIRGLMIETHWRPDEALSDARQQIAPKTLCRLLERLHARDTAVTDRELKRQMAHLRAEISNVDARIIQDLAERMNWVEQIGRLKHEHNIAVLQLHRWEHLLEDHIARAERAGLDPRFIKDIFEIIHAQAIKRQL